MIRQVSTVITDATGKEFLKEQTQAFNFIANSNDIHNYIASRVQAHWHREIEVFTLLSGDVKVDINDQCYTLHTGQGCFINSNVLHTFTAFSDAPCLFHSLVFNTDIRYTLCPPRRRMRSGISSILQSGRRFVILPVA